MEKMCDKIFKDIVMTTLNVSRSPGKIICYFKSFLKSWKLTIVICDEFVRVKCVVFLEKIIPYLKKLYVDIFENFKCQVVQCITTKGLKSPAVSLK